MTDVNTGEDMQKFLKQALKNGIYMQEEINQSRHDKCMKGVGERDKRGRNKYSHCL